MEGQSEKGKRFGIDEKMWYREALERGSWRRRCRVGLMDVPGKRRQEHDDRRRKAVMNYSDVSNLPFKCATCTHTFKRRQDIARHTGITTRPKGLAKHRPPS